jgi:DHA3 family tetracycline resistance protein-like MFS transporter
VLSLGLAPVSYALTGPVADELGARSTLLWCGLVGCVILVVVFLLVPGVRDVAAHEEEPGTAAAA